MVRSACISFDFPVKTSTAMICCKPTGHHKAFARCSLKYCVHQEIQLEAKQYAGLCLKHSAALPPSVEAQKMSALQMNLRGCEIYLKVQFISRMHGTLVCFVVDHALT